jgi:hypothetical protein
MGPVCGRLLLIAPNPSTAMVVDRIPTEKIG